MGLMQALFSGVRTIMLDATHFCPYKGPMNRLPFEKRRQILHLMVEGNSIRGIARLVDVSPVTVLRQLELAGKACAEFHDANVRNVRARKVQCDEIWSFVFAKDKNAKPENEDRRDSGFCLDVDRAR